jgi:DNA-binding transcriptional ArsR family regulator
VSGLPVALLPIYMWCMIADTDIAIVGSLVGDPARANMLSALMGGRALTATELACAARVSPQTTSGHLAKLLDAKLLEVMPQGRHRYYRLANAQVGHMIEAMMEVATTGQPRHRPKCPTDEAMRTARTCYDHLAGLLGVGLATVLQQRGHIVLDADGGEVTEAGRAFLQEFGVDLSCHKSRRVFCRPCIDWTERRPHIAGSVGAALADRCFALGWVARVPRSRALAITAAGRRGLREAFDLSLEAGGA